MAKQLAEDFTNELFAAVLNKRNILDIAVEYLKYSFLQTEEEKVIWKRIHERYNKTGKVPTMGQLQQYFIEDEDVLEKLS